MIAAKRLASELAAYEKWLAGMPDIPTSGGPGMDRRFLPSSTADIRAVLNSHEELLAVALAYEQWESDMILCHEAWKGGTADLPTLTQKLWDRLLEIQTQRNAAKRKAIADAEAG